MSTFGRIARGLADWAPAAAVSAALAYACWPSMSAAPAGRAPATDEPVATYQLWADDDAPGLADGGPDDPVEVGVRWMSSEPGQVTALRFYKAAANTGVHVGHLWSATGKLLASVTFKGETPTGWQTARLASPVAIARGQTLVASYHTTSGHYAFDAEYFMTGRARGPLQAPQNGVAGNGVFAYGPSGTFPSRSFNASNYWVDVVVTGRTMQPTPLTGAAETAEPAADDSAASCPCTFFGNAEPGTPDSGDRPVEVGFQWKPAVDGVVTAIRFFKAPSAAGPHEVHLWTGAGRLIASARVVDEGESGWQEAALTPPAAVTAGATYVASYYSASGRYAYDRGYFTATHTSGPLQASGSPTANGLFSYGPQSTFPSRTYSATNYWVDVVFTRK